MRLTILNCCRCTDLQSLQTERGVYLGSEPHAPPADYLTQPVGLGPPPCNFDASSEGCPPTLAGVPVQSSLCLALWLTLPFGHVRRRAIGIVPVGLYWPSRIALPSTTAVRMHDSSPLCPQRTACPRATRPLPAASDGPHRPVLPRRPPTARRPGESTPAQPERCALSKRTSTKNSGRHPPKCSRYFFFRKHWHQFSAV